MNREKLPLEESADEFFSEVDRPMRRRVILAIIATYLAAGVAACGVVYILGMA